jgi:hypothetical protein
MTASLRILPGLTALVLSVLSGLIWKQGVQESLFVASHIGSIVLCVSAPVVFFFIGRKTRCDSTLLILGAVLLTIAAIPMLAANGIYLVWFGSVEAALGDIGAFGLMLLGWIGLVSTSIAFAIISPLTTPTGSDPTDNGQPQALA